MTPLQLGIDDSLMVELLAYAHREIEDPRIVDIAHGNDFALLVFQLVQNVMESVDCRRQI